MPPRTGSSPAPMRLTRRGRVVIGALLAALCCAVLLAVTSGRSSSGLGPVPSFDAPLGALDESKVPNGWGPRVAAAAKRAGIPGPVMAAQLEVESGWNPKAVSSAGAQGLAQFTPDAWKTWGKGNPFSPTDAIAAQGRLMENLMARAGASKLPDNHIRLALAGYNAGFGNVTKHHGVPPFPETQHYVDAVARAMGQYAKPLPPSSSATAAAAAAATAQHSAGPSSTR